MKSILKPVFIFLLFVTAFSNGQETIESTVNQTTSTSTEVPIAVPELNPNATLTLQPTPSTTTEIPLSASTENLEAESITESSLSISNSSEVNVSTNQNGTIVSTAAVLVPFTVVIEQEFNTTAANVSKANGTESTNEDGPVPKINEIPPLLIVEVLSDAMRDNTTIVTPIVTIAPVVPTAANVTKAETLPSSHHASENIVEDWAEEIEKWEAPLELQKAFPYYLTGFDDENRPIWVSEWGKFDLRKIVEAGNASMEEFNKYARKAVLVITKSHDLRATPENPVTQAAFIVDFDGMKLEQYAHLPTINYALGLAREHRDIIQKHASRVVVVNTNFFAEAAINLSRNVFGRLFERVEVFGTNKSRWIHALRRIFPADQLPEWYGGTNKNHKPIWVYG